MSNFISGIIIFAFKHVFSLLRDYHVIFEDLIEIIILLSEIFFSSLRNYHFIFRNSFYSLRDYYVTFRDCLLR